MAVHVFCFPFCSVQQTTTDPERRDLSSKELELVCLYISGTCNNCHLVWLPDAFQGTDFLQPLMAVKNVFAIPSSVTAIC